MSRDSSVGQLANRDPARLSLRVIVVGLARSLGVVSLTLLGYAVLPVEGNSSAVAVAAGAAIALLVFLVIFFWQLSRVSRAAHPFLAALEALCLVFGMFIVLFALQYVALSSGSPQSFTEPITKVSGVYFVTTVLSTVGFGDISPVTDLARTLVTVQIVLGMILIGSAVKVLGFTVRRSASTSADAGGPSQRSGH